eukprot:519239_1
MSKSIPLLYTISLTTQLVISQFTPPTLQDIIDLRQELREEFEADKNVLSTTVRLIFHDCSAPNDKNNINSICNGCIHYNNPAHAGLFSGAIEPLEDVYISEWNQIMSRSDFWAAAATIAIEYAQELDTKNTNNNLPSIPYYFGRRDCGSTSNAIITNAQLPEAHWGWKLTKQWFLEHLEFTTAETVAILGAHTLGRSHLKNSGYSSLPWAIDEHMLNNEFYINLLDKPWIKSQSDAGKWEYIDINNQVLMLNTDMALWFDIDSSFDSTTMGKITCEPIRGIGGCPVNMDTIGYVEKYKQSNQEWLNDFAIAFEKLILTGYDVNKLIKLVINTDTYTAKPTTPAPISGGYDTPRPTYRPTPRPITPAPVSVYNTPRPTNRPQYGSKSGSKSGGKSGSKIGSKKKKKKKKKKLKVKVVVEVIVMIVTNWNKL